MKKIQSNTFTQFKFPSNLQLKGSKLVYTQTSCDQDNNAYHHHLFVYDLTTRQHSPLTFGNTSCFKLFEDENTVLFTSSNKQKLEETHFYHVDLNSKAIEKAFSLNLKVVDIKKYKTNQYLILGDHIQKDLPYQEIEKIPFYLNGAGFTFNNQNKLYLYDSQSNELTPLIEDKDIASFEIKDDNVLVLYSELSKVANKYNAIGIFNLIERKLVTISQPNYSYSSPKFFTDKIIFFASNFIQQGINDNKKIYTSTLDGSDFKVFVDIDLDLGNSIGTDARFGSNTSVQVISDTLYFTATVNTINKLFAVNSKGELSSPIKFDGCLEGYAISDERIFVAGFKNLDLSEIYDYTYNLKITDYSKVLNEYALSNIETITFTNDDIHFEGYVIKPIGFDSSKTYPALLEIHGGPKTAYGTLLHHEMQLLANEGYFVFFMNPRGSSGRGVIFSDIRGKYGTIDYSDLMTFTDEVLKHYPQIDKNRLGVLGGSYGGFMTNWIVTHTDRFKAANTQRCISNWISFYGVSDIGYFFGEDQTQGNPWDDLDKIWEASPLKHIRNCKTPLLIIHSDADYRCPLEQAYQLFTALQLQETPTKLVVFKNENHDLSRTGTIQNRIKRLDEIVKWFNTYL